MNTELLKLLVPVIVEGVRGLQNLHTDDIEQMTLEEIRQMLIDSEEEWPELDFGKNK